MTKFVFLKLPMKEFKIQRGAVHGYILLRDIQCVYRRWFVATSTDPETEQVEHDVQKNKN